MKAVERLHACIQGPAREETGAGRELMPAVRKELASLIQEYSNSLVVVEHALGLCSLRNDEAFERCRQDRDRYHDLITVGRYPVTIEPFVFKAEQAEFVRVQQNLRTMLFTIGRR